MINLTLFQKEIRENRLKFIIFLVLLSVLAVVIPLIFEPTRDFFRNVDLSPHLSQAELAALTASYDNFAWSQWTAKNLPQLTTLAAIVLGMGALAGEFAYGTALFLVSRPVTRREIYTTKAAAGLFLLALLTFAPTLLLTLISALKEFAFDYSAFLTAALITFAGASVIYLGTAIFSALINEPIKAGVLAALFWLAASVPGYFTATAEFSIFYQMKAVPYWFLGQSPIVPLGLALVLGGILYEGGVWFWSKREF